MEISELYKLFCQFPHISTDSRHCPPNSIFFALKGEQFDGNDYVESVLEKGAIFAVADRKDFFENGRIIIVEDVLQTLQELASYHRRKMHAKVIGITGTNGKTTTKELIATILSKKHLTLYTEGNLNNHIGVPLTLLQLNSEHEFAVIEMGANHPGEIQELCTIAEPDYGLITNIGKAHLEGFGSFEGVINTKVELYNYIRKRGGTVFANSEDDILSQLHKGLSVVYYGKSSKSFVSGKEEKSSSFFALHWEANSRQNEIQTHLIGRYNLYNILAAICVGVYFQIEDHTINEALSHYVPSNNRSQKIVTSKNEIILDAYNANPSSMEVALANFGSLEISPKMIILGEMKELGKYEKEEHLKLLKQISENNIDEVLLVGKSFNQSSSLCADWIYFSTTDELIEYLNKFEIKGFQILIKGSRGNQLEKVIPFL